MKFIICLMVLAACPEALPRNRVKRNLQDLLRELESELATTEIDHESEEESLEPKTEPFVPDVEQDPVERQVDPVVDPVGPPSYPYKPEEYGSCHRPRREELGRGELHRDVIWAGDFFTGAYWDNECQGWTVVTDASQCIQFRVGSDVFETEQGYDFLHFQDANDHATESRVSGEYQPGEILFGSSSNVVNVTFTSDFSITMSGFRLDARSVDCSESLNGCTEPEVVTILFGETIKDAMVPTLDEDGRYKDYLCQQWTLWVDKEQGL